MRHLCASLAETDRRKLAAFIDAEAAAEKQNPQAAAAPSLKLDAKNKEHRTLVAEYLGLLHLSYVTASLVKASQNKDTRLCQKHTCQPYVPPFLEPC